MSDDKAKMAAHATFTAYLESRRLRNTPERFYILDKVMGMPGSFEVDAVCGDMDDETYRVSRATVYNTLSLLVDCGILRCCPHTGRRIRYEKATGASGRIQLVCSHCGKTKDLRDADLFRQINARRFSAFHAVGFTITVYGICSRCMRRNKKESIITKNTESTVRIKKQ